MDVTLDGIRDIKLYQSRTGYRFSVDALLLYSFVQMRFAHSIADLGAGSGIVGMLLAKKYPQSRVTFVELQNSLYRLLKKNLELNGLAGRSEALRADLMELKDAVPKGAFDLAVSNPPFRKPLSGRLNEDPERAVARHELRINLAGLLGSASGILRARGRFVAVYHPVRLAELLEGLRAVKLEPKRLRFVHGRADKEARMLLLEAVKDGKEGLKVEHPLFVYEQDGSYTNEMKAIYGQP